MNAIFLNTWHNRCKDELAAFITQKAPSTDIFCFHEADSVSRRQFRQVLRQFTEYAADKQTGDRGPFNLATYVKQPLAAECVYTLLDDAPDSGFVLVVLLRVGSSMVTIANVHGIAFLVDDKLDTEGRLEQSKMIIEKLRGSAGPIVIGGDFNLLPETSSIRLFAQDGFQDLIAAYNIRATRNRLAWDRHKDNIQRYADYVFVGSDTIVRNFSVPELEISDHLPLVVAFDVAEENRIQPQHTAGILVSGQS